MILFLELLGFLTLFTLLALVRASHYARLGFEDDDGFHYGEEALVSTNSMRPGPKMLASSSPERTARDRAA